MKWFNNMKIGNKLILSFILVAAMAGYIGWQGYIGLKSVYSDLESVFVNCLSPTRDLGNADAALLTARGDVRNVFMSKTPEERQKYMKIVADESSKVDQLMETHTRLASLTTKEKEAVSQFQEKWSQYKALRDKAFALLTDNKEFEALEILNGNARQAQTDARQSLHSLLKINEQYSDSVHQQAAAQISSTVRILFIIALLAIFLSIVLGIYISRSIGNPLRELSLVADKIALGDVNVQVEANTTDEIGDLKRSFEKMVENIRENAANAAELAKGNLDVEIETRSSNDVLAISMRQMVETLRNLANETRILTRSSVEGKLEVRGNIENFTGGYRDIVKGINETLDALIGPLNVAAEYVDRISKGDIPPIITDNYNGDFNEIKSNLNRCIETLNAIIFQMNEMYQGQKAGDIEFYIKEDLFQGAYRQMAAGVNGGVRLHVENILKILGIMTSYADGDFSKVLEKMPGKQIIANQKLDILRSNLLALIADSNLLARAALEGKLDVRADASKHPGDFGKVVQGMNETLNAVVGPLNVAAEYIDRISKGDIPPKVTDAYQGDFNEIKNNLNKCINGLAGLVEANTVLQRMAVNDYTVAVTGQYQGVFAEVALGVNGVQERVKHVIETVTNVSQGDLSDLEVYRAIGNGRGKRSDNDELVPSLIRMMESLKATIADIEMLSRNSLVGKLDTRADASKHQGEFRKIVQGVNNTLDAVIGPLNVAAEYVDRISKGDIPPKITDTYNGDFNEIKNNLNACIEGLGGLIEANAVLQRMALNDYTVGVNGQYQGVFAEVAKAVNDVQLRIKVVLEVVKNISNGDMKDLARLKQIGNGKGRRSDNDELAPSLIRLIESLKATIADINMLAQNTLEGKLDIRADASLHAGDFRMIVEGVNATLDAIIEPVKDSLISILRMADGDFTTRMTGNYKGDLSKIKDALNTTLDSLNDILGQANTASEQVVSGANQVSDAAQSLSQGATEQASSLEEITASMTEMNSQTKQNAENAQQANKLAAAARDNAQTGNERMREMLEAMKEINDSSGQISRIIKVIDEIAFQTNLLALNAAVEAARAGVHGKGFAVVADEVRNLAQRSAKAAKETTDLIENSIKKVENGTGIANETAKALNEIVSGVTKVTALVGEIASASNEQAQGIAQVNQGLGQVDQVTQANTANAEESAAAAEELSGQAANLQHMIKRFQLTNRNGTGQRGYQHDRNLHDAPEQKTRGRMAGHEGRRLASQKPAMYEKTTFLTPVDHIALDDDEI